MLCLPEFDTYHILPEYAQNPEDIRLKLSLHLLKKRAVTTLQWRVLNCRLATEDNADALLRFQLGSSGKLSDAPKSDITKMSPTELMDFYNKAVAAVGLHVDPAAFTKEPES